MLVHDLFEAKAPRFYHGSSEPLERGRVYRARPWSNKDAGMGRLLESFVERFRPPNAVPRARAFFMTDDPSMVSMAGGSDNYVYEVVPVGRITKGDIGWLGEIDGLLQKARADGERLAGADLKQAKDFAQRYWVGEKFLIDGEDHGWSVPEYLTPSLRVKRIEYERW